MGRVLILSALLMVSSPIFSQEINFINQLSGKKVVTFGEGVRMYMYALGRVPRGFDADVRTLKDTGLLKKDRYDADRPLRRGMLALMVARHLKLKGSLFYMMFDTRRYAHRACVGEKIMAVNTSEFDKLTGDELIEVISIVTARMEGAK
ncbi:MAG: hypothetical protein JW838_15320 [Spirochaetes bacterium]|nr:hypothetical protein [Spirochaetota bacterium]